MNGPPLATSHGRHLRAVRRLLFLNLDCLRMDLAFRSGHLCTTRAHRILDVRLADLLSVERPATLETTTGDPRQRPLASKTRRQRDVR